MAPVQGRALSGVVVYCQYTQFPLNFNIFFLLMELKRLKEKESASQHLKRSEGGGGGLLCIHT